MKRLWLALLLVLTGCEKVPEGPAPTQTPKPSLVFEGFTAQGTRAGVLEWEAKARTAQVFADRRAMAQEVFIRYFQDGREVSRARSDEADIKLDTHDLTATGNVVLRSSQGVVLYTDHLRWNNARQRISSEAPVKVIKGENVLTGVGMTADRKLEDVEVLHDVQVRAKSLDDIKELSQEFGGKAK